MDKNKSLINYDARLRDNVAVDVVTEVTDTVQVCNSGQEGSKGTRRTGSCNSVGIQPTCSSRNCKTLAVAQCQ